MSVQTYFSIVIAGVERFTRTNPREAHRLANKLRNDHGKYAVWIRPHYRILSADGSPVNL